MLLLSVDHETRYFHYLEPGEHDHASKIFGAHLLRLSQAHLLEMYPQIMNHNTGAIAQFLGQFTDINLV